jgi:DNA polymerase-3 subunit delta'
MQPSEVQYQEEAKSLLRRALASGRLPHAYIFSGPPGVGKEMLANRLAQVLLCGESTPGQEQGAPGLFGAPPEAETPRDELEPCGQCVDCELFAAGTHPDFHRVHRMLAKHHPDSNVRNLKATVLGVDVIREFLIKPIGVRPSRGRAKLFIVAEAERLSDEAQNAMLKTLEEPPGHSYLILLADSTDSLLATTRSRCQPIHFGALPDEFVAAQVMSRSSISESEARFLAALSQGSLGLALRYAGMDLQQRMDAIIGIVERAAVSPISASKTMQDLAKELAAILKKQADDDDGDTNNARDAQLIVCAMIATVLRDVLRVHVGASALSFAVDARLRSLAAVRNTESLRAAIQSAGRAEYHVARNANAGLIFDEVAIQLCPRPPVGRR